MSIFVQVAYLKYTLMFMKKKSSTRTWIPIDWRPLFFVVLSSAIGCGTSTRPVLSEKLLGSCVYTGPSSGLPECKEYRGEWSQAEIERDCGSGTFSSGVCVSGEDLGECLLSKGPAQSRILVRSTDTGKCGINKTGCEFFGGGFWVAAPRCGGAEAGLVVLDKPFIQPTRSCRPPKMGEPSGKSANGQVCTYNGMHGATEEGRLFTDYASCDVTFTQRAYYPSPPSEFVNTADLRRSDNVYLAEEAWVKSQVRSQSCVCCHSNASPKGAVIFDVDREGSLANQMTLSGLAQGAGWKDSTALGAWPAEQNNGFQKSEPSARDLSIFMSTNPQRMRRFFESELAFRKATREQVDALSDPILPLTEALNFRPQACAAAEGVSADGIVTWLPGRARYVYVLEATSTNPSVPPNLDLPQGTLWRIDLPPEGNPVASGTVRFGEVPNGMTQVFPRNAAPQPLQKGKTYFLAAFADVIVPLSRCLFVAK